MVKHLIKLLGIVSLTYFISVTVFAAEITATVDRNPIPVGESFQFTLDARGSIDGDPDFTELQKTFKIINSSQSSNFRLINGSITRNKTWTMVLMVEEAGNYTIPAINFGKDTSDPIAIQIVANAATQDDKQQAEIYLEIDVEPKSVFVQQQVIYTIKLFRRIQLSNASLSEPVSENNQAIVTKLGDDRDTRVAINGVAYSVLERRYALFPQKSGPLKITPLTFETQIVRNSRQRSFFNMDPFTAGVKRLKSKAVEIQVKSIPAEFTKKYPGASWLAVENLSISESWSGNKNELISGEPMTRTISLTAQNSSTAQLPDIKTKAPKNIKIYPDVPVITEQHNSQGLVASKEFKTALLATKTGKQTLPEIEIPWWNTRTNRIEVAKLPAQIINVSATVNQTEDSKLKLEGTAALQQPDLVSTKPQDKPVQRSSNSLSSESTVSMVWIIVSVVLAILWLFTLYLFLQLRSKYHAVVTTINSKSNSSPAAVAVSLKKIKEACLMKNASLCRQLLLQWANNRSQSEQFTNLSLLLPYADKNLQDAIKELEQHLYGNNTSSWNGDVLWSAFNSNPPIFISTSYTNSASANLPSLYANYK